MTADEYAKRVQALVLSAGCRRMETAVNHEPNASAGLFELAIGAAASVRGKGREHETDSDTQAFERPGEKACDWLAQARDELTDCAAWLTGADEIATLNDRARYRDTIIWHLACAIDALDSWTIFERNRGWTRNPQDHYSEREDTLA